MTGKRLASAIVFFVLLAPARSPAPDLYSQLSAAGTVCAHMIGASAASTNDPVGRSGIPMSLIRKKVEEIRANERWKHVLMGVRQYVVDMPESTVSPEQTARARIALLYDMMTVLEEGGMRFGVMFLEGGSRLFFGPDKRIGIIVRLSDGRMFQGIVSANQIDETTRMPVRDWQPRYATEADENSGTRVPDIFYRLVPGWQPE